MLEFQPPERDIEFLLFSVFKVQERWADLPAFADFSEELVRAVVREAGRLASEVMAPLNQSGDEEGCHWDAGEVRTPAGFKAAFDQLSQGGWLALSGNPEFDGQGMPKLLGCLIEEMFWAANASLYLYGTLTVGATICINAHGSAEQKALYLPKLYSGQWTGAMALTEAHAGTDLGIMRSKAEPAADGSYRITGTKIFITSGEHDLAENIVHLVLAKLPDAPGGTRGISLFIVPKYLTDEQGNPGQRNAVASGSLEHKMGIRGSATSVMNYDGAVGYLIGEANAGLAAMFTMMNYERLSVGLQGLGASELGYQQAVKYARDRLQGRAASGPTLPQQPADPLLVHADVRRMLLTIRTLTEAGRAFAMYVGMQLDLSKYGNDAEAERLSQLLTPVAKAFFTDRGLECAVLAQQVFGGHGFVREWGVEQIVRDVRIGQIYEGTNGIQAADLIGRKVVRDGGKTLELLLQRLATEQLPQSYRAAVIEAFERLRVATRHVLERASGDPDLLGAVATDYLDLVGYTIYAWFWAEMAGVAQGSDLEESKRHSADFYFARVLPRAVGLAAGVCSAGSDVMQMAEDNF